MLDEFKRERRSMKLLKLGNFPRESIDALLLRRGISPTTIRDLNIEIVVSPRDALNYSFKRRDEPPPYGIGRFGNGGWPVFYSALEKETCEKEVRHRQGSAVPHSRYFQFMACDFLGGVADLRGAESKYPDLVSPTESGYPFCQALAQTAIASGVDALQTPSARNRPDGVCCPVFSRSAITNPRFTGEAKVTI